MASRRGAWWLLLLACGCSRSELSTFADTEAPPPETELADGRQHVLFLAGQSNLIAQLGTEPHAGLPDVQIPMIARSFGAPGFEYDTGPTPVPLDMTSGFHSIELSAAQTLLAHGAQVRVAKLARGGSWLGEWRVGAPTNYWSELVAMRDRAVAAWGSDVVWHFVWLQSESDSQQLRFAEQYEGNLRGFVAEVRELFGPIEFYQCKLQPSLGQGSGTGPTIRAAQERVMNESRLDHLLDFDDLKGGLHYTSSQLDVMGERAARAIIDAAHHPGG